MIRSCFITVGTTQFKELINVVASESVLDALKSIGITKLSVQVGASVDEKSDLPSWFNAQADPERGNVVKVTTPNGIQLEWFTYKTSISEDIEAADLIIGHAGAGTCFECLQAGKMLIVVVNEKLMDNHQTELAKKLADLNALLFCVPNSLEDTLRDPSLFTIQPAAFNMPPLGNVSKYLDRKMGVMSTVE